MRALLVLLAATAVACTPTPEASNPSVCPVMPPCQPAACTSVGLLCGYHWNGGHRTQCNCVLELDAGADAALSATWQCGGC